MRAGAGKRWEAAEASSQLAFKFSCSILHFFIGFEGLSFAVAGLAFKRCKPGF
jgi:hypothetical protein